MAFCDDLLRKIRNRVSYKTLGKELACLMLKMRVYVYVYVSMYL